MHQQDVIYLLASWSEGIRSGLASFQRSYALFQSLYFDQEPEVRDRYILVPIDPELHTYALTIFAEIVGADAQQVLKMTMTFDPYTIPSESLDSFCNSWMQFQREVLLAPGTAYLATADFTPCNDEIISGHDSDRHGSLIVVSWEILSQLIPTSIEYRSLIEQLTNEEPSQDPIRWQPSDPDIPYH